MTDIDAIKDDISRAIAKRVPFEHGLMLARGIPKARLVALESKNHIILSHESAWHRYISELSEFLQLEESERLTAPV